MLEKNVVSLEMAKQLEELGVPQKSLFVWEYINDTCYGIRFIPYAVVPDNFNKIKLYAAFTSSELINLLPPYIDLKVNEPFNYGSLVIQKKTALNIQYLVSYYCDTFSAEEILNPHHPMTTIFCKTYDENLSHALAKMIIYLVKNNLMEIKK